MKISTISTVLATALVLSLGGLGCKKTPKNVTMLPGGRTSTGPVVQQPTPAPPVGVNDAPRVALPPPTQGGDLPLTPAPTGGIPAANLEDFGDMLGDRERFKAETVYFDFDRSAVRPAEQSKVETVASFLKSNPANKLQIEGHCDERGTEEYNRALGERRAQSIREALVSLGVGAERIRTISYGEDKPAEPGHDEAAWSRNRRGEFVLLLPKE
jgi:peptidoglycan-associated lipoprotein